MLFAKEEAPAATVQKEDIRLLGRLNVNLATRDELLVIPGIDGVKADEILGARARGKLTSLTAFQLAPEAAARLTIDGVTTLRRIRALPLEIFSASPASATR